MSVLVAWLWQGVALAMGVAVVLRGAHRLNAATRHLIWWGTLAAILVLPLIPLLLSRGAAGGGDVVAAVASGGTAGAGPLVTLPGMPRWLVAALMGAWLGLAALGVLRIVRSLRHLRSLEQRSVPLAPDVEARLTTWRASRDAGRAASVHVSHDVGMPCALGLGRALILLPHDLVTRLGDADLDQIVTHEHGHLVRRDDWWRLAQAVVEAVFGLHPAVLYAGRQIELEREAACDDYVVACTGAARRYAACLAETAAVTRRRGAPILLPGATRSGSALRRRVIRLLDQRRNRSPRPARAAAGVSVAALAGVVVALGATAPLIAFRDGAGRVASSVLPSPGLRAAAPAQGRTPTEGVAPGGGGDAASARAAAAAVHAPATGSARLWPAPAAHAPEAFGVAPDGVTLMLAGSGVDEPPPPLAARAVDTTSGAPHTLPSLGMAPQGPLSGPDGERRPWRRVAGAGAAVGTGLQDAGVAAGGFVARAGKAVAGSF